MYMIKILMVMVYFTLRYLQTMLFKDTPFGKLNLENYKVEKFYKQYIVDYPEIYLPCLNKYQKWFFLC